MQAKQDHTLSAPTSSVTPDAAVLAKHATDELSPVAKAFADWSDAHAAQPSVNGPAEDRWAARYNAACDRLMRAPCASLSDLRLKTHFLRYEQGDGEDSVTLFQTLANDIAAMAVSDSVHDALLGSAPSLSRAADARSRLRATLIGGSDSRIAWLRDYVLSAYGAPAIVCLTDEQAVSAADQLMAGPLAGLSASRAELESKVRAGAVERGIRWVRRNVFDVYNVKRVSYLTDEQLVELAEKVDAAETESAAA